MDGGSFGVRLLPTGRGKLSTTDTDRRSRMGPPGGALQLRGARHRLSLAWIQPEWRPAAGVDVLAHAWSSVRQTFRSRPRLQGITELANARAVQRGRICHRYGQLLRQLLLQLVGAVPRHVRSIADRGGGAAYTRLSKQT